MPVPSPGFFGKVPARGDFLARRIPAALRGQWEKWLSSLVLAAREALGEHWPDEWLTAPVWHFALGCELAPEGAAGVLIASADRVGRLFPFTVIGACSGPANTGWTEMDRWARSAEALTLSALADDFEPDRMDAALQALGPPPTLGEAVHADGQWPLEFEDDLPIHRLDAPAATPRLPPGPDQSVWYCRGSRRVPPMHLRCTNLPDRTIAAAMITGAFDFTGSDRSAPRDHG
jgi:type VI secretion system protein ImpM